MKSERDCFVHERVVVEEEGGKTTNKPQVGIGRERVTHVTEGLTPVGAVSSALV